MKVYLDSGEDYPVYYATSEYVNWKTEVEIPEEKYKEWKAAIEAYNKFQEEAAKLLGED